ncbi:hypothetical protein F2Q68_00031222 [Brassica cretica]|uniref:Uncharacterized protein n=1 Tax=Brassica cretica TaxID=69181 RepID=A0A8S9G738_BRACR|nr:hypothetical protein F2Q68_00031222 [Brassica cretica]
MAERRQVEGFVRFHHLGEVRVKDTEVEVAVVIDTEVVDTKVDTEVVDMDVDTEMEVMMLWIL